MNVAVCVKQIPKPDSVPKLDPQTRNLDRSGPVILDEADTYSVEMALQLADATGGGDVTLVSMAPNGETAGVRTGLAMGAAKGIVITDDALAGADALSTAKVLAAALARVGADLVLAATESTDGYTGTVPVQVAELMSLPAVTFAKHIEVKGSEIHIQRQTEQGYDDIVCSLPAVVTVTAGVVEPRYPSFKGITSARSKPIDQLDLAGLGLDAAHVGGAGAGQQIIGVDPAEARAAGEVVVDKGEAELEIIAKLEEWKVI